MQSCSLYVDDILVIARQIELEQIQAGHNDGNIHYVVTPWNDYQDLSDYNIIGMSFCIIILIVEYPYKLIVRRLLHTIVAKLLYLCKCARPDIMTSITRVKHANEDDKHTLQGYIII